MVVTTSNIPSTPADGRVRTVVVDTLADPEHPTVTELKGGKDISLYITLGGFNFSSTQATINDQREAVDQDYQRPGRMSIGDASITYIDNTNGEFQDQNAAAEALTPGANKYIVRRRGLKHDADWEADQKVTVIPVQFAEKQLVAGEENSVQRSQTPFFVTGKWYLESATVKAN